jgi:hypothetical protein
VGDQPGRILSVVTPDGQVEAFFRATGKEHALPPQDPALFRAYGFELVGPPLDIELGNRYSHEKEIHDDPAE